MLSNSSLSHQLTPFFVFCRHNVGTHRDFFASCFLPDLTFGQRAICARLNDLATHKTRVVQPPKNAASYAQNALITTMLNSSSTPTRERFRYERPACHLLIVVSCPLAFKPFRIFGKATITTLIKRRLLKSELLSNSVYGRSGGSPV